MHYDPFDSKSQRDAREATNLRRALVSETEETDVEWLMSSVQGRRIVDGILNRSCIHRSFFSESAATMAFVAGRQVEGARLIEIINRRCPEMYPVMLKEQTSVRNHAE